MIMQFYQDCVTRFPWQGRTATFTADHVAFIDDRDSRHSSAKEITFSSFVGLQNRKASI